MHLSTTTLPTSFLWGASTASHQVEGGNTNNDSWYEEHLPNSAYQDLSGDACDSYHRWPEDLDLVADAGLNAYRFSLEWSRIEPAEGEISRAQLDHYQRIIDGCRDRGLAPVVTICHFTVPLWFHKDGSWTGPSAGDRFARFTETVLPILSDAEYVVTLNEPNLSASLPTLLATVAAGGHVNGLPEPDQELADALLLAHQRSMEVLRGAGAPPAGLSLAAQEWIAEEGGEERMRSYRAAMEDQFLDVAQNDGFVGVQAYSCARVGPEGLMGPKGPHLTQMFQEYRPEALGNSVSRIAEYLPKVPIVVTENGIATADDTERISYTEGALAGLRGAMQAGADVRGYLHWSLLDNFEWNNGYRPTFGLVGVDRTTFARTPKPSLAWLGERAAEGALVS
jgi:beta-glucosidase